jgi:HSP20 family protein
MSVSRFEPFRDPLRELDRLFPMAPTGTHAPLGMRMDVCRGDDGSYHVEADLPGADPDSVGVTVEHGVLTIQAGHTPHHGDSAQVIEPNGPQGAVRPAAVPGRGRGPGEPHRRLRRRCPARDHPSVTQDPGPPG